LSFILAGLSVQQNETTNSSNNTGLIILPHKPPESNKSTCPLVYSYRVYQTVDKNIDQIAIENINFSYVDVYVWSRDLKSVQYESYSSNTFAEKYNSTRFTYIGDATAGEFT